MTQSATIEAATRVPAPRIDLAACLEAGGLWLLALLAGAALALAALLALQGQQVQALQDARLQIALQNIRQALEADLALGFDLGDNARAQPLLEDTLAQDPDLVSVEVFDRQGVSLFNTDRGSIGEAVPAAWLATASAHAAQRGTAPWRAGSAGDAAVGLPVLGPFGEVSGHIALTPRPVDPPSRAPLLLAALAVFAGLALLALWRLASRLRQRLARMDHGPFEQAHQRLARVQARLQATLGRLGENTDTAS